MKRKLRFVLPRLALATLIIGAAAFIMFILFKLLLGVLAVGALLFLFSKIAGKLCGREGKWNGKQPAIVPREYAYAHQDTVRPFKTRSSADTIVPVR